MSLRSRAWMVTATLGTVEAMKDHGFARWNYTMRSVHKHVNNKMRSYAQAKKLTTCVRGGNRGVDEKAKQAEESLRKVMYLSCWAPI